MNAGKLVVGLSGMPGSGKSLVVETAKAMGYDVVTMGDVVREQTRLRGLEPTPQNIGKVMLELRAEEGNFVIAKKCIPKIEEQTSNRVLVDGLRSLFEADIFREHFASFTLVSVHAPPQVRFERLKLRGRSDDPQTYDVFHERDKRELGVGLGNVIALSEKILVNDNSVEGFKALVKENFGRIEEKWLK
ncbi:MAG: AAA family ATPase [Candidatus Bathyarchaeia archaeon]|jgi:dephospho-CoA kinase